MTSGVTPHTIVEAWAYGTNTVCVAVATLLPQAFTAATLKLYGPEGAGARIDLATDGKLPANDPPTVTT